MRFKRLFIGLLSISFICLLSVAGYYGYRWKVQRDSEKALLKAQNDVIEAVKRGEVVIDDERHTWSFSSPNRINSTQLGIYIRNKSSYIINGNLVFSGQIDNKGIETQFFDAWIDTVQRAYGAIEVKGLVKERDSIELGRAGAFLDYVLRGSKPPAGLSYEPISNPEPNFDYSFTFRKPVFLRPGEIKQISHDQDIPMNVAGYLLEVKVTAIEFK